MAKRSTFLSQLRHGKIYNSAKAGETTITLYIKNKKTGKCAYYCECSLTGDLPAIKCLLKETDITNNTNDYSDIEDVIEDFSFWSANDFIDMYVNEPILKEILLSKFNDDTWSKLIYIQPIIKYNQDYLVDTDEWYRLFINSQELTERKGISHIRISLCEHFGTWFLPINQPTWYYK
jgi:hypothetical protein